MVKVPAVLIEESEFQKYNNLEQDLLDIVDGIVIQFEAINTLLENRYPEIVSMLEERARARLAIYGVEDSQQETNDTYNYEIEEPVPHKEQEDE